MILLKPSYPTKDQRNVILIWLIESKLARIRSRRLEHHHAFRSWITIHSRQVLRKGWITSYWWNKRRLCTSHFKTFLLLADIDKQPATCSLITRLPPASFYLFAFEVSQPSNLPTFFKGEGVEKKFNANQQSIKPQLHIKRICGSKLCCGGVVWRNGAL